MDHHLADDQARMTDKGVTQVPLRLTKEADLATAWDLTLEQLRLLRRRHGWSHVRMSRQDIRYTDAQIEQIVRDLTVTPPAPIPPSRSGLTPFAARG